jgi:membrane protease subunit HflC
MIWSKLFASRKDGSRCVMKSWKRAGRFCPAQFQTDFGIELLDERFKRSKYNPAVAEKIIDRMSSERHQIAARFRSEGRGEAANISGQKESDVASISSTATKNALETEGKADAQAAAIYSAAFGAPDAQELFSFLRSLDVMRAAFEKETTAVISTNSDLGRLLKSMAEAPAPPRPPH